MSTKYPYAVFIQTVTGCNSDCVICPQKKTYERFGRQKMSMGLYKKILLDLTNDYTGQIGLYLQYEPLLDPRLFEFIELAKHHCPKSSVEISSNAGLLTKEKAKKLSDSKIDIVYFNFNGGAKETYEKQMRGQNFEKNLENIRFFRNIYEGIIRINFVLSDDIVSERKKIHELFPKQDYEVIDEFWAVNRAGNVEIKKSKESKTRFNEEEKCKQLDLNLPILATGEVILCCNDWMREVIIGDVNKENVLDIWRSPKKHYRYEICKRCY